MKLYLASFLQPENFGPGRLIGIANGSRPEHVKCDLVFKQLIPSNELVLKYNQLSIQNSKEASKIFVEEFSQQLEAFYRDVLMTAKDEDKDPVDILPFLDGDTLASWERENFTNYRKLIAPVLEKLGYEVVLH